VENYAAQDSSKSSPGIPDTLILPVCRADGCGENSVLQCCSVAMCAQYAGTAGRFRSAGIKNETPWSMGQDMRAGVQTARNRTVVVCEPGDHGERGSGRDDDVFYLFLQKQKIGAELHIYLEEGTYHKSLFRGPNTNDMKK
jgi:hypothetical protein